MSEHLLMDVDELHRAISTRLFYPTSVQGSRGELKIVMQSFKIGKYGLKLLHGEEVCFAYFTGMGTTKSSCILLTNARLVEIYDGQNKHVIWLKQIARADHTQHVMTEDTMKVTYLDGNKEKIHVFYADVCAFFVAAVNIVAKGKVNFTLPIQKENHAQIASYTSHAKRVACPSCAALIAPPLGHCRFRCPACKKTLDYRKREGSGGETAEAQSKETNTTTNTNTNTTTTATTTTNTNTTTTTTTKEWRCHACCYVNRGGARVCTMCEEKKPAGAQNQAPSSVQSKKPSLGLDVNANARGGMVVSNVIPNMPGSIAGLRVGDVITTINGYDVHTTKEFFTRYASVPPDSKLCMAATRGDKEVAFIIQPIWVSPQVLKTERAPPPKASPKAAPKTEEPTDILSDHLFSDDLTQFFASPAPSGAPGDDIPNGQTYDKLHSHEPDTAVPVDLFDHLVM